MYPDRTEARLDAFTQASSSTPRDRRRPPARYAASWVFPHDRRQPSGFPALSGPGTSATTAPGAKTASIPGTLSVRSVNASASGGTSPVQTGQAPPCAGIPAGSARVPDAATRAAISAAGPSRLPPVLPAVRAVKGA